LIDAQTSKEVIAPSKVGGHCEWFGGTRFSSSHHSISIVVVRTCWECCHQYRLAQVKDGDSSFIMQQTMIQFLCSSSLQSLPILFEAVLLLVVIRTCWECCHQYRLAQVKDGDSSFITQQLNNNRHHKEQQKLDDRSTGCQNMLGQLSSIPIGSGERW
jgi:hypothetical protein